MPKPKPKKFDAKVPLLSAGRSDKILAQTETIQIRAKVASAGTENALHTHTGQDHAFFVLSGEAKFYDDEGTAMTLTVNEGILLPAGSYYRFESSGEENLVVLRFAGKLEGVEKLGGDRVGPDQEPFPGDDPRNKPVQPVESGERFGD